MKLTKIKLNELANADLNEREMCRLLGGYDTVAPPTTQGAPCASKLDKPCQ